MFGLWTLTADNFKITHRIRQIDDVQISNKYYIFNTILFSPSNFESDHRKQIYLRHRHSMQNLNFTENQFGFIQNYFGVRRNAFSEPDYFFIDKFYHIVTFIFLVLRCGI
ncbi:MAG: hypothetical protein C0403_04370 [Desulfobacterium sp.]|nr:hypothetical protein [Desulfobacterium sp.]